MSVPPHCQLPTHDNSAPLTPPRPQDSPVGPLSEEQVQQLKKIFIFLKENINMSKEVSSTIKQFVLLIVTLFGNMPKAA